MTITRFAPSPTGALHLGGARTALFNFLFARANKGKFLLRIEDTDQKRSTPEALTSILDGLRWLGLDWDDEPVFQSQRGERYGEIVQALLQQGAAYYCDCSPAAIEAARAQAMADKRPVRYDRTCRERNLTTGAVRIKMPTQGDITIQDKILGPATHAYDQMDDFIIQRSDFTATYMLSVVVDDHDMGISHIIRGNDHFTNAARQAAIYTAQGWQMPIFAHIPLIHGNDNAKLSKRHGAQDINEYRTQGYLPEAMRNYLCRLGWAHGNEELFSTDQAIAWFSLAGIGKSPARFDEVKLDKVNQHYLNQMSDEDLLENFCRHLNLEKNEEHQRFIPILRLFARGASRLTEWAESVKFLVEYENQSELQIDKEMIADLIPPLEASVWDKPTLEGAVRAFAEKKGGLKIVAQALRVAIVGRKNAPSIFDTMVGLGKTETLKRLRGNYER